MNARTLGKSVLFALLLAGVLWSVWPPRYGPQAAAGGEPNRGYAVVTDPPTAMERAMIRAINADRAAWRRYMIESVGPDHPRRAAEVSADARP